MQVEYSILSNGHFWQIKAGQGVKAVENNVEKTGDIGTLIYKGLSLVADKRISQILHGFWGSFLLLWPSLHRWGSVNKELLPRSAGCVRNGRNGLDAFFRRLKTDKGGVRRDAEKENDNKNP